MKAIFKFFVLNSFQSFSQKWTTYDVYLVRSKITGGPELGTHEFHYLFSKNSLLTGTGNSELDKKLPRRL